MLLHTVRHWGVGLPFEGRQSRHLRVVLCALCFVLALGRFGFVANNIIQKIGGI